MFHLLDGASDARLFVIKLNRIRNTASDPEGGQKPMRDGWVGTQLSATPGLFCPARGAAFLAIAHDSEVPPWRGSNPVVGSRRSSGTFLKAVRRE